MTNPAIASTVNIVTADEAYEAAKAGKKIVAKHKDDTTGIFNGLNETPASAFFDPDWQFGIKVEMVNINGHEFTKPVTLDELTLGQDIYFVGATGKILKGQFIPDNTDLLDAVNNGSVQRDEHNARLQLTAIRAAFGIDLPIEVVDTDFSAQDNEPKKRRGRKTKEEKAAEEAAAATLDMMRDPEVHTNDEVSAITLESVLASIQDAQTLDDLGHLSTKVFRNSKKFSNLELEKIQISITEKRNQLSQLDLPITGDDKYQKKLKDLVTRAQNAATVAEANALAKYTTTWTEEQRKPLLTAIHGRIVWLNDQVQPDANTSPAEQPSLMVQLQNAPNLDALEALKLEVLDKPLIIQAGLMQYYTARRAELLKIGVNDE